LISTFTLCHRSSEQRSTPKRADARCLPDPAPTTSGRPWHRFSASRPSRNGLLGSSRSWMTIWRSAAFMVWGVAPCWLPGLRRSFCAGCRRAFGRARSKCRSGTDPWHGRALRWNVFYCRPRVFRTRRVQAHSKIPYSSSLCPNSAR
jgi:hypothetical protein